MKAVNRGQGEMAAMLLRHGADVNIKNMVSQAALSFDCSSDRHRSVHIGANTHIFVFFFVNLCIGGENCGRHGCDTPIVQ
jgi:hypothetical protein